MKRIAIINQKGGVGKTTTTVNLGAALAFHGQRVLLLDLDPQANMTVHVDKRPDLESNTLTNLLIDDTPLDDLVLETAMPNLFVVPSDTSLAGVEQVLASRIGRETILRHALDKGKAADKFDFVLFDCPPSLGVLSANALVAADYVVIPMQAEYLSLQGMAKLLEVIDLVKDQLNSKLQIACVLPCMLDSRTNLSMEVLNEIEEHFGSLLTKARIRNNVKLAEAPSFGRSIFEHAPDSNGARDYAAFALEFMERVGVDRNVAAATQDDTEAEEELEEEVVAEKEGAIDASDEVEPETPDASQTDSSAAEEELEEEVVAEKEGAIDASDEVEPETPDASQTDSSATLDAELPEPAAEQAGIEEPTRVPDPEPLDDLGLIERAEEPPAPAEAEADN